MSQDRAKINDRNLNVRYCAKCNTPYVKEGGGNIVYCPKCKTYNCALCVPSPVFKNQVECYYHVREVHKCDMHEVHNSDIQD